MTPIEALELAVSKEEAAIELYRSLALEHSEIRELLNFLMTEEEKHKKLISEKIVQLRK